MKDLLAALIPKLRLPTKEQKGRRIVYKLHHVQSKHTLSDNETLSKAGVRDNHTCLLLCQQPRRYVTKPTRPAATTPKRVLHPPKRAKSTRPQETYLYRVKSIIAKQLLKDEGLITLETTLVGDLNADELDMVELVMEIEDEFGISIPDDDIDSWATVRDIVDYLRARRA